VTRKKDRSALARCLPHSSGALLVAITSEQSREREVDQARAALKRLYVSRPPSFTRYQTLIPHLQRSALHASIWFETQLREWKSLAKWHLGDGRYSRWKGIDEEVRKLSWLFAIFVLGFSFAS
jgi:hypothetical protein